MAKNEYSVSSQKRLRRLGWIGLGVLGLIVLAMIPGYRLGSIIVAVQLSPMQFLRFLLAVISGRWLTLSSRQLFCTTRNDLKSGPIPEIWTRRYIRDVIAWMQV